VLEESAADQEHGVHVRYLPDDVQALVDAYLAYPAITEGVDWEFSGQGPISESGWFRRTGRRVLGMALSPSGAPPGQDRGPQVRWNREGKLVTGVQACFGLAEASYVGSCGWGVVTVRRGAVLPVPAECITIPFIATCVLAAVAVSPLVLLSGWMVSASGGRAACCSAGGRIL